MLPEWLPETIFNPQCFRCARIDDESCNREVILDLYRDNYIKCPRRKSAQKLYPPQTDFMERVEKELTTNRSAYTKEELAEAEATYRRVIGKEPPRPRKSK